MVATAAARHAAAATVPASGHPDMHARRGGVHEEGAAGAASPLPRQQPNPTAARTPSAWPPRSPLPPVGELWPAAAATLPRQPAPPPLSLLRMRRSRGALAEEVNLPLKGERWAAVAAVVDNSGRKKSLV